MSETVAAEFDWSEGWYGVQFERDLDRSKPTRFVLLGQPLAIWWQEKIQQWVVFRDRCPHRLAPLSEGRMTEDGCLECPYHGWAFSATGACDRIPFQDEKRKVHLHPRAAVQTYPSRVVQGILFVYAGNPENADAQPVPIVPDLDKNVDQWTMVDIFRDIPYDAITLLENVLDPSHVAFTHHPRVGNRANAKEFLLEVSAVERSGFAGFWEEGPRQGKLGPQKTNFTAPHLMWHDIADSPFGQVMTVVYATPIEKGKCRALVRLPFRFKSAIPRFIFKITPRWYSHLNQMSILEDDQIFLHLQEREFANTGESYGRACYLPTNSDRFVVAYRQWIQTYGEPFPHTPFPPVVPDRNVLLERYQSHTQNCPSCRTALEGIQKVRFFAAIAILFLWVDLPLSAAYQLPVWVVGAIAVLIPILAGLWWKAGQLEGRFFTGDYPPARNTR
ncbi:MAG: Rieske 2Fe-2S domain-containing protein [Cyanobacteria bacterium P01_E01_bin.42]